MIDAFPCAPRQLQLGVGLDLPWGGAIVYDAARGDGVARGVVRFLERHVDDFGHLFVSWQPRDRAALDARDYYAAYDDLFARVGDRYAVRAIHQTALNLGALET